MAALKRPGGGAGEERLARLKAYRILDTPAEGAFDELVRRAQEAVRAPMAWLSFFDGEREWIKAKAGVALAHLPREHSLAFGTGEPAVPLLIEDAASSEFKAHPMFTGELRVRFFCALPLAAPEGTVVGTLTVLDRIPRTLSPQERTALENLASLAVARLEARLQQAPAALVAVKAVAAGTGDAEQRIEHLAREYQQLNELLEEEIGLRRGAEERLRREKEFSDAMIQSLPGAFYLIGPDALVLRWNSNLAIASGYSDAEIVTMRPWDFMSPRDRGPAEAAVRQVLEQGKEITLECEVLDRAGNIRPYAFSGRPLRLGGRTYMIGVGRDITLRKRAEQQMARSKERLDLALTSSNLALWDWDIPGERVYFNESWATLLGDKPREATFSVADVLSWNHPEDHAIFMATLASAVKGVSEEFDCEYRVPNAAGEWIWVHSRGKVTHRDGERRALRLTGTTTNVTKRKAAEERAEYLSTRDALTGLPNRVLLHDRLEQGIVAAARSQAGFAFMFIDLDRFKTINDSLGHQVGDELLKRVAARLSACVRASDTVARLGGDEFAVILENLKDDDESAQAVAEKMIAAMGAPMLVNNQHLNTSCSIGISLYPSDGKDSATLMKHADVAMYYAKDKGRNNYQFFSAEMNARAQERLSVENYLRLALRRNELVVHYQPRMRVATGELVGVEALIRWQHPRRGLLPPGKFIEVAEDSGLIVPIGEWVLEQSCAQIRDWQERVKRGLRLSVNLSVGQVVDGERLFGAVSKALKASGIAPATLELELTESLLMQNIGEKAALLHRLGELGVGLAIDDFGTGYSSLAYLKALPVDSIKIDSSFVRDIHADPNDEAIIRAILAMAHSMSLKVIAEGVETEEQLGALRELGCDEYQGFLTSPALAVADFERRYLG